MKRMLSIISVLMTALSLTACNGDNGGQGNDDSNDDGKGEPKSYATVADAAKAAQQDMLAAMEKGVNFGVDGTRLRSAAPGAPIMRETLKFEALLQTQPGADSTAGTLSNLVAGDPVTVVPLVAGADVVTIVGLRAGSDGRYGIGSLGDRQISEELNTVMKASGGGGVRIYEVPNLQATIYGVTGPQGAEMYYTSYGGASLRQAMNARSLLPVLQRDAAVFQRTFGDEVKKQRLVR